MSMEGAPMARGEFIVPKPVIHIADLSIGSDDPGRVHSDLTDEYALNEFAHELEKSTRVVANSQTMVCMEDRPMTALGNGDDDPDSLLQLALFQWAGGMGLATAKALLAANSPIVRGAKNMQQAYEMTVKALVDFAYQDGGHANCGAAGLVEPSVAQPVAREIALPTLGAIMEINASREKAFDENALRKQRLLESGFYGDFKASWHEDFLQSKFPENFSHILTSDGPTHGHEGDGLYVVTQEGQAFAKNDFYHRTGKMAFGITPPKVVEVANRLGATTEEREAILMGFAADVLDVSDKLLAPGFPVFGQQLNQAA